MELLDLEKPAPDACAELRLGQAAEQELGLEDAAQVPVGAVRSDSWRCKRRGPARLQTQSCFVVTTIGNQQVWLRAKNKVTLPQNGAGLDDLFLHSCWPIFMCNV
jgi:hypothetical protein